MTDETEQNRPNPSKESASGQIPSLTVPKLFVLQKQQIEFPVV